MRVILVILLAGMVGTLVLPGLAQSDRASIVGTVKDTTGAVIPNAKVKITNVATGQTFETDGNEEGRYVTPSIFKPGTYKVEASKEGFKIGVVDTVVLNIGDVREVNIALELGAVTQTVTVSAQAQQLETETSSRGEVITGREIIDLPIKDRNFTQLATLTPGVSRAYVGFNVDQTAFNQGDPNAGSVPGLGDSRGGTPAARFSRSGGASISANGLRPTNNNFSLDGVDNNEPLYGGIGVFPNPDAIQEFKVETSVAKAEVGRGGATVNTTFQSGTNSLRGSAYYYGQNDALNATPWVINRDRASTPSLKKSITRIHEFGGTVGGPIIKNRTFFFADYLGQRNRFPNIFRTAVPTALSRTGDFSEFDSLVVDPRSCPVNPATGFRKTKDPTCKTFNAETGKNAIPNLQSNPDFSKQAFDVFSLFPLPTTNVRNPKADTNPNFIGMRNNQERINAFDVKIDHRLTNSNNLMGRYSQNKQSRVRANFFPKLPTAGFGAGEEIGNTRQVVVTDNHVFRPTLLNEARFGYTRVELGIDNCGVEGACGVSPTFCNDLGIPNCNKGTLPTTGGLLTGGFGTGQFEFIGDGGPLINRSNNFYVADNMTVISGKHTWKAGVEARPRYLETLDPLTPGNLKGHLQWGDSADTSTGNVQADYLLKIPATVAFAGSILGGPQPFNVRTTEWSFFVQDDWKLTPNLALNLGLRYDLFPGFHERDARMANYDVASASIIRAKGSSDSTIETDKNNLGPRVGFAWNFGPARKFVLRGGYGIFYAQDAFGNIPPTTGNPPLANGVTFDNFAGNQGNFNLTTGPPVAPIVDPPVVRQETQLKVLQHNQKTASIQEWNLTVQWEFARDWLFDVGYVSTRSRKLLATRQLGNKENGLGLARTPTNSASCPAFPNPCFINDVVAFENRASSNYDSLQSRLEKRFSRGLELRTSYTFSHNIDDSTGVFNGAGETRGNSGGPQNPLDFRAERANSSIDRRHLLSANLIWDLPLGKGRTFGSGAGDALDKLIGGWQTNFIWTAQSGQPFGVEADPPGGGQGGRTRADIVCDPFKGLAPDRFLNVACFAPASSSVKNVAGKTVFFGNSGRNAFTGPGFFRTDWSIIKDTAFKERYRVQFGIQFFNAFNQVHNFVPENFINRGDDTCNPAKANFNPATCSFGKFNNALPPRTIQYRLKVFF